MTLPSQPAGHQHAQDGRGDHDEPHPDGIGGQHTAHGQAGQRDDGTAGGLYDEIPDQYADLMTQYDEDDLVAYEEDDEGSTIIPALVGIGDVVR